jgi:hypothetical protein
MKSVPCFIPLIVTIHEKNEMSSRTLSIEDTLDKAVSFIQKDSNKNDAVDMLFSPESDTNQFYFINEIDAMTYDGQNANVLRIYNGYGEVIQDFKVLEELLVRLQCRN